MSVIRGTVLDAAGKPVAGARVYVTQAPGPVPDVAVLSDAAGRFTLAAARAGRYEVACSSDALGGASVQVTVGSATAEVELRLA